jgi:hypothetical protein
LPHPRRGGQGAGVLSVDGGGEALQAQVIHEGLRELGAHPGHGGEQLKTLPLRRPAKAEQADAVFADLGGDVERGRRAVGELTDEAWPDVHEVPNPSDVHHDGAGQALSTTSPARRAIM